MSRPTIIDMEMTEASDESRVDVDQQEVAGTKSASGAELVVTEQETTLEDIVGERGLDVRLAAAVVRDVARQVHVLHRHGVPHGKISAGNITVGDDASVDVSLPAHDHEVDGVEAFSDDQRDLGTLLRHLVAGGSGNGAESPPLPPMLERIVSRAECGTSAEGYRSAARLAAALDRYLVLAEWGLIER